MTHLQTAARSLFTDVDSRKLSPKGLEFYFNANSKTFKDAKDPWERCKVVFVFFPAAVGVALSSFCRSIIISDFLCFVVG